MHDEEPPKWAHPGITAVENILDLFNYLKNKKILINRISMLGDPHYWGAMIPTMAPLMPYTTSAIFIDTPNRYALVVTAEVREHKYVGFWLDEHGFTEYTIWADVDNTTYRIVKREIKSLYDWYLKEFSSKVEYREGD